MSSGTIGPLLDADEFFNHQIVDTFATVSQSDYSWTEKVCGMAAARDGSLSIGFGTPTATWSTPTAARAAGWSSGPCAAAARSPRIPTASTSGR